MPYGKRKLISFKTQSLRQNREVITTYPHPNIRLIWTKGTARLTSVEAQALHRDQPVPLLPRKIIHRVLR
jgi:hypothetical protein